MKLKIIFLGTPEFGAIILEELIRANFKPVLVITAPDKPVGRKQTITPPPVKVLAEKYGINVIQPEQIQNSKFKIQNSSPDLIVVAAYGQILPKEILDIPKYGCLNVHPSLLPEYRGATPVQFTILNGNKKTGATIILMDEKMDHGPILAQREWEIPNPKSQTLNKLLKELANLGAKLLVEVIPGWIKGEIKPKTQDHSKATYTKILTKEDGRIDWKKSAEDLERQIRAFDPWPGSYTNFDNKTRGATKIKILKAKVFKSPIGETFPLGKVLVVPPNKAGVQCRKDFLLIEELQLEGRKPLESEEFLRGHPDFIGTILK